MIIQEPNKKYAVIIGGGPAGLTAAYELAHRTQIIPIVVEADSVVGGICKTIDHNGNRIDIGGHRFFSKSDRVINWWLNIFPLQTTGVDELKISYHAKTKEILTSKSVDPDKEDRVMLVRKRNSRIYFLRTFFDYPIKLSAKTLSGLGFWLSIRIGLSYFKSILFPVKPERNLEDFFVNRFGKVLYETFFRSYTEKVWGQKCTDISAEWGKQRIKGLSITKSILHIIKNLFSFNKNIHQKNTETSLIEYFMYPKLGPGQFWDEVAGIVKQKGGHILTDHKAVSFSIHDQNFREVKVQSQSGTITLKADYVFSTMPVQDLVKGFSTSVPDNVKAVSEGLFYRDFFSVGLLLKKFNPANRIFAGGINDNWIYIQEPDVKVGRLQIFNNWSPYMVADKNKIWIGLEYFCKQHDELWNMSDDNLKALASDELVKMGIAQLQDIEDGFVVRMPKAYPAYFGRYPQFQEIRKYTDQFENLFLIGRNGMHKYNNQDHSMLTAMVAVDNIVAGITAKDNLWEVNTEEEYHEER